MARINQHYHKLQKDFLFTEISERTERFLSKHPDATIFKLGIGDTTEPLKPTVIRGLIDGVKKLSEADTYMGYGDERGEIGLRKGFVKWYKERGISFDPDEIFLSDGAKTDLANIPSLFHQRSIIAVQDPVYPMYVDSNVIAGRTGRYKNGRYKKIVYMPCIKENNFTPSIPDVPVDLIYLCMPNNPTGSVMTKKQLETFVTYAKKNKSVMIFDTAYAGFVNEHDYPRSIYEIPGAKSCAIEINSLSKSAGFTGVRFGWTVVPKELVAEDTQPGELNAMWRRRQATMFNGVSHITQQGVLSLLTKQGQKECGEIIRYYMGNARMIKSVLIKLGFEVYGGVNGPYLWVKTPEGVSSWKFFDTLLEKAHIVVTPGVGFGPQGEGYVRFSAFGHREDIKKAVKSLEKNIPSNK